MFGRLFVFLSGLSLSLSVRLSEQERVEQWHRIHTWPPNWHVESPGYRRLMEEREREIMAIPGADERWENWMQFVAGRMVKKFTPHGFQRVKIPEEIFKKLSKAVHDGLLNWENLPEEKQIDAVYTRPGLLPKFIYLGQLANEIHRDLLPLHEAWSGLKLIPTSIYGVRFYQNGSSLTMHHDKMHTHVISSIVHLAHEYDDESNPWPIDIEDHDGTLHSVNLEAGDLLFYESAKCLHGRMKEFRGKYYGSVFVHYRPVDYSIWNYTVDDAINAVPPHWSHGIIEERGSRWSGQSITTDSRVAFGAGPRLVGAANPRSPVSARMKRHTEL